MILFIIDHFCEGIAENTFFLNSRRKKLAVSPFINFFKTQIYFFVNFYELSIFVLAGVHRRSLSPHH